MPRTSFRSALDRNMASSAASRYSSTESAEAFFPRLLRWLPTLDELTACPVSDTAYSMTSLRTEMLRMPLLSAISLMTTESYMASRMERVVRGSNLPATTMGIPP